MPGPQIAAPNTQSLQITLLANDKELSSATGFLVSHEGELYLVTNWHVLSGRHAETQAILSATGATPDAVRIRHTTDDLSVRVDRVEPLRDSDGNALWLELPLIQERRTDVAALRLTQFDGVRPYLYDVENVNKSIHVPIAERLSVIGFPFGITAGQGLPIWTQAFVATEPELAFDSAACFLVDSRTRTGQSGSPVIYYSESGMFSSSAGGLVIGGSGINIRFMGIYSGRINPESDLGRVWFPWAIAAVLKGGQPSQSL